MRTPLQRTSDLLGHLDPPTPKVNPARLRAAAWWGNLTRQACLYGFQVVYRGTTHFLLRFCHVEAAGYLSRVVVLHATMELEAAKAVTTPYTYIVCIDSCSLRDPTRGAPRNGSGRLTSLTAVVPRVLGTSSTP